jgi:hypothetical protein
LISGAHDAKHPPPKAGKRSVCDLDGARDCRVVTALVFIDQAEAQ